MTAQLAKTRKDMAEKPVERSGSLMLSGEFPFFFGRLRDEFDQFFERFTRRWPSLWPSNGWRWGIDVRDENGTVVVRAEAPGFEPDDFDIEVHGNQLVMRAARKTEKEEKERGYREEQQQECYEALTLPCGVDAEKVTAKYLNGVLTVTLPKTSEGKGKRIPVKGS